MLATVLDYIAKTNLFNFIIFAGIIAYLFVKLDVIGGLKKGSETVAGKIDDSKTAKSESEDNLKTIEDKVANLEAEVNEIIKQSESNAGLVGGQILTDAEKSAENIHANTLKLVENKTAVLKNDIIRRVSLASVEVAKRHIIDELHDNKDLHNKLIDQSIDAITELE